MNRLVVLLVLAAPASGGDWQKRQSDFHAKQNAERQKLYPAQEEDGNDGRGPALDRRVVHELAGDDPGSQTDAAEGCEEADVARDL